MQDLPTLKNNMLDLVFTTNQTLFKVNGKCTRFIRPYRHHRLLCSTFSPFPTCQASQKCHLFGKANWEALSDYFKQQQKHLRRQWSFLTQGGEGRS